MGFLALDPDSGGACAKLAISQDLRSTLVTNQFLGLNKCLPAKNKANNKPFYTFEPVKKASDITFQPNISKSVLQCYQSPFKD